MPPKTSNESSDVNGPTPKANDIIALCKFMTTCELINADNKLIGEELQILPKNVPRKINQIVNPYGFEWKNGKMCAQVKDGAAVPATPVAATGTVGDSSQPSTPKKKATPKKAPATPKCVKTPRSNKKRKVAPEENETAANGDVDESKIDEQYGEMHEEAEETGGTRTEGSFQM